MRHPSLASGSDRPTQNTGEGGREGGGKEGGKREEGRGGRESQTLYTTLHQ